MRLRCKGSLKSGADGGEARMSVHAPTQPLTKPGMFMSCANAWRLGGVFLAIQIFSVNAQPVLKLPPLAPPKHEIPPTFWELHGFQVIALSILALVLAGVGVWLFMRPRKSAPLPPATLARNALGKWQNQPETGKALSEISQVLRNYIVTVFGLPAGERTTTEFVSALADHALIGPELARSLTVFLKECDRQKFSLVKTGTPLNAVVRALELITQAEARLQPSARANPMKNDTDI